MSELLSHPVSGSADPIGHAPSILWKAFAVLDVFDQNSRQMSLAQIARRSGLPKSTAHRLLGMLGQLGAVERDGDRYRIGLRMFALGTCSVELALRDVALPHMEALQRASGQTLHLAVLQGGDVVYLERLRSRSALPVPTVVGGRLPAHLTGVGKVLLAHLPAADLEAVLAGPLGRRTRRSITEPVALRRALVRVRELGTARDLGEAVDGLACVAVPIRLAGKVVAAMSVGYPAAAGDGQPLVGPLRETAVAIARALERAAGPHAVRT